MVIDPNNIGNATTANAKGKLASAPRVTTKVQDAETENSNSSSGDSVSLSSQAQSLGKLEAAVDNASSVDSDKVSAVKSALQSGQYRIDADAIAAKILDQDALL